MRCILHIGPSKTGSSSIQYFLRMHEETLRQRGIWMPRLSQMNMAEFRFAFRASYQPRKASQRLGLTPENYSARQKQFRTGFARRLKEAREAGANSVIITAESISKIGLEDGAAQDEIAQVTKWLSCFVSEVTVVPVLRRQDLRSVSRYKNIVKNHGWTEQTCLVPVNSMDLGQFLGGWAKEFGQDCLRPLLFPDSVPENRDLIEDFCAVAGIEGLYNRAEAAIFRRNSSIDGRAIEIMRQMNIAYPAREIEGNNRILRRFAAVLENHYDRPLQRATPSRNDVATFLAGYEEINETIRALYFPERERLFCDDISAYPEKAHYPDFDREDVVQVLTKLLYDPPLLRSLEKSQKRDRS